MRSLSLIHMFYELEGSLVAAIAVLLKHENTHKSHPKSCSNAPTPKLLIGEGWGIIRFASGLYTSP